MPYDYSLSPLNTDLETRLRSNLANEGNRFNRMFTLQKGEATDRITGAQRGINESIADRFAGWKRGSGLMSAAMSEAGEKYRSSLSDAMRGLDITQLGMEADQKNKDIAQSIDYLNLDKGYKQSIMEANLKADLANAGLAADKEKWQAGLDWDKAKYSMSLADSNASRVTSTGASAPVNAIKPNWGRVVTMGGNEYYQDATGLTPVWGNFNQRRDAAYRDRGEAWGL